MTSKLKRNETEQLCSQSGRIIKMIPLRRGEERRGEERRGEERRGEERRGEERRDIAPPVSDV